MGKDILKFSGFRTELISYRINPNFDEEKESEFTPMISFNLIRSDKDSNKFNLLLGVKYREEHNLPFYSEIMIRGYFTSLDLEATDEEAIKTLTISGSAIMYPYIRSILTDITSKSDYMPIILPVVNFYEYVKPSIQGKDIMLDSKLFCDFE